MAEIALMERPKDVARKPAMPQPEHLWLKKFLGEWESEGEVELGLGPEPGRVETTGKETVRPLGDLWVVVEGRGAMLSKPDADDAAYFMTIGYDPLDACFLGSWTGSVSTHQWVYEGDLDDDADELTLYAEGPDMSRPGETTMYKDVISFTDDDHRVLRSYIQEQADEWRQFVEVRYRRRWES